MLDSPFAEGEAEALSQDQTDRQLQTEDLLGRTQPEQQPDEPGDRLFSPQEVERFREQWQSIQTTFVDDPQDAVRGADHLVAEVMQTLASTFAEHKRGLEDQWQRGADPQTEDLRQALRSYRSFFNQLLHT